MNVFSYGNVTVIFAKSIANSVSFDTFCKKYQKVSKSIKMNAFLTEVLP